MSLINCKINLTLTWSGICVLKSGSIDNQVPTFAITDTNYAPVVTLSNQINVELLDKLNAVFNYLIELIFQGVNRLFILLFKDNAHRTTYKRFFLPTVETKDYNVMIYVKDFFDQPVKNERATYDNVRKILPGQGDDYTQPVVYYIMYFKNYYKMIATNLSKQQALDVDPKAIQQIKFTGNPDRVGSTAMFFIIEEAKGTILDFSQGTVRV